MCKETMKAVVVPEKVDGSVEVREVPVPAVGHGQALVKIEYSGVCHTDRDRRPEREPHEPQPNRQHSQGQQQPSWFPCT